MMFFQTYWIKIDIHFFQIQDELKREVLRPNVSPLEDKVIENSVPVTHGEGKGLVTHAEGKGLITLSFPFGGDNSGKREVERELIYKASAVVPC